MDGTGFGLVGPLVTWLVMWIAGVYSRRRGSVAVYSR